MQEQSLLIASTLLFSFSIGYHYAGAVVGSAYGGRAVGLRSGLFVAGLLVLLGTLITPVSQTYQIFAFSSCSGRRWCCKLKSFWSFASLMGSRTGYRLYLCTFGQKTHSRLDFAFEPCYGAFRSGGGDQRRRHGLCLFNGRRYIRASRQALCRLVRLSGYGAVGFKAG